MKPKMMPGQEPYSNAELEALYSLVSDAAQAQEIYGEDELEWRLRSSLIKMVGTNIFLRG